MSRLTDKVARRWVFLAFAFMAGCGGAPFTAIDEPLFDGGTVGSSHEDAGDPGELDAGSRPDVEASELDAAPDHAASGEDAAEPVEAAAPGLDSAAPPACATEPPVAAGGACAAVDVVMPTSLCVDVETKGGSSTISQPTPAACASWCTFTCECLDTTAVCGAGTMTFCYADTGAHGLLHVTCND